MAITRIKNNQITDSTIVASGKVVAKSVTAGLLEDNLTYGSNLTVSGNLTVNGSSTTVNSTTVSVDDPMLLLAPDATGSGALDLGFIGERGDDTNIAMVWDESDDEFALAFTSSADSSTTITITNYADLHAGGAAFDDNVTIGGTLGVTGAVTLSDDLSAVDLSASGNLSVTGTSTLSDDTTIGGTLGVTGASTFTGDMTAGNIDSSTLDTTGNVTIGGTLDVTAAVTMSSTLDAGNTTVGSLDASGLASLDGGIDVDGAFTVANSTGNVSTTGTLNVDGASTLNDVTLDASSTFDAGGNKLTNLADPTSAQDAATKAYIDTALQAGWILSDGITDQTIDVSASDTMTVSGTTNEITAVVSATDTLTIGLPDDVTIGNDLTVTTNTSIGGTLDAGNTSVGTLDAGNTTITGTADVSGAATVGGTMDITGQTDIGAALNVTGLSSLDGGIDMDGVFTVADTTGDISTTGDLNVDGDTTMANVTIDASSTIDAGANKITNVADPTVDQDAATKVYVDDAVSAAATFDIAGDTGTDQVITGTDTLTFSGTANEIVTAVTDNEVTISLPDDVTIGNDLTVTGDLTVNGTTTTVNSTTVTISDPVFTMGDDSVDDNKDRGIEFKYNDGSANVGFFGFDDSAGTFTALTSATNTGEVFSGTAADVVFGDATLTNTGITGTLDVSGLASLDGGIDVDGVFTVADTTGNVSTTGTLAAANTNIDGTLDVSGLASLDGGIDVDGAFTVADTSGNVSTSGTMNVDGAATFNGNVTLGDAATDSVTITADISSNMIPGADSTYDIGDNADRWANIYVDAATVTDNVTVGGTLGVTGETTLASATVSDLTDNRIVIAGTAGSLEDDANLTFDGTTFEVGTAFDVVAASGNTNIAGTLDVAGTASLDGGIDVDGAFIVSNTSGNISTTGTLNVDGASTLNDVTLDASTTFDAGANKLTNVADPTANQDAATKKYVDDLTNTGFDISDGSNSSTISGGDTLTFNDTSNTVVTVSGDSVEVAFADNIDIAGTLDVTGATTLDDALSVAGTLDVDGNATFNGNVDLQDNDTLNIGTGDDFSIVHTGTATSISNDTGILSIDGATGSAIRVNEAGADVDFIVETSGLTAALKVDAGTDSVVIGGGTTTAEATLKIDATDSFMIAKGTTAQRPGTGVQGMMRYNTTSNALEYHDGSAWRNMTADFTVVVADSFSGDGSTTAFTLSSTGTTATTIVSINGVVQIPTTAYGVSGTTLTFTEAPATGDVIDARVMTTTSSVTGIDDGSGSATIDANGDGSIDVVGSMSITGNIHATGSITADGDITLGDGSSDALVFNANVSSDIFPTTADTYDLGSTSKPWQDVYTGGTVYMDADASNYVAFTAPATVSSNVTWTLPSVDASVSGYALVSDGAGTLSWAAAGATTTSDTATNSEFYIHFDSTTSGAVTEVKHDAGLRYNPSTGTLTSAAFAGNLTGDVTGNADTATTLATARTISLGGDLSGSASFDGSANVTISATIGANSVALGTDTTGNYVAAGATSGNGISGSVSSEGGTFTVTSNATSANTANTIVYRDASGNFTAGTITGTATAAQYADLAEKYTADADIEPGTVVCFGGEAEVTTCNHDMDRKVAGIVSTNPAHLMNAELEGGVAVALTGRVPCKVIGPVSKGDMMVSAGNGMARAEENPAMGSVIGKALGNNEDGEGIIEVVVGRL